jgi:hypothetical protein
MGKRSSFAAGATAGAAKKAKKTATVAYSDAPIVSNWSHTKFTDQDLWKAAKSSILKDDATEVRVAGLEVTPNPPAGFWVIFLAFILRGLSFPPHEFLRGLLFAYGIQLHDLNPNTILHIGCFITLCECFLGIKPHWALWRQIFAIRRPLAYHTGGFNCLVRPEVDYFNLRMPENNPSWRTRWFYAKDQPAAGQNFGIEEFCATNDLRPRLSWAHALTDEEVAFTEPFLNKIAQLRSAPEKEATGLQLIRTFIKRQVQPLAARALHVGLHGAPGFDSNLL